MNQIGHHTYDSAFIHVIEKTWLFLCFTLNERRKYRNWNMFWRVLPKFRKRWSSCRKKLQDEVCAGLIITRDRHQRTTTVPSESPKIWIWTQLSDVNEADLNHFRILSSYLNEFFFFILGTSCSDSDSGYCADSGSEHSHPSPKRDFSFNSKYPDWRAIPNFPQSQRSADLFRRWMYQRKCLRFFSMSALKVRKSTSPSGKNRRNEKPLKVRFADIQQDSEPYDERFRRISSQPSPPPLPPPPSLKYYYVSHESNPNPKNMIKFPYPPPYEEAVNRIHFLNEVQGRKQRSSSLGRDCSRRRWQSDTNASPTASTISQQYASTSRSFDTASRQLNFINSMETIVESEFSTFPRNSSRKLFANSTLTAAVPNPGIMPAGSCDDIIQLESTDIAR